MTKIFTYSGKSFFNILRIRVHAIDVVEVIQNTFQVKLYLFESL